MTYRLKVDRTVRGSARPIVAMAYRAPSHLATSAEDGSVKIWDTTTDRVLHGYLPACFPDSPGDPVTALLWRGSKGRVLLAAAGRTIYTLSVDLVPDAPRLTTSPGLGPRWTVAEDEINALLAVDASRIALADDSGSITLLDTTKIPSSTSSAITTTNTSQFSTSLKHAQLATCLTLIKVPSNSGSGTLISGALDCTLKLWCPKSRSLTHQIDISLARSHDPSAIQLVNPPYVNALASDPLGGGRFVAGLGDGAVLKGEYIGSGSRAHWDVQTAETHPLPVTALLFMSSRSRPGDKANDRSADEPSRKTKQCSDLLVTASNDKTCKLWHIETLCSRDSEHRAEDEHDGSRMGRATPLASLDLPGKVNAMVALSHDTFVIGDVLGNLIFVSIEQS